MAIRDSFRLLLETEYKHRKQLNHEYSVRFFAKDLGVDHSLLAKILKGSRSITPLTLRRLGPKLGLSQGATDSYLDEILSQQVKRDKNYRSRKTWIKTWTPEKFSHISEWYYPAILVAMSLRDFDPRPAWISRYFGIAPAEAAIAMEQLEREGYFTRDKNGRCIVDEKRNSVLPEKETTTQLKRYQKQYLFKAIAALEEVKLEKRDNACVTVATSQKKVEQSKILVKAFRRKLMAFLEDVDSPDQVYAFTTSLFPLTRSEK
jgi:uncharacterized protein (TIGR02147 family)